MKSVKKGVTPNQWPTLPPCAFCYDLHDFQTAKGYDPSYDVYGALGKSCVSTSPEPSPCLTGFPMPYWSVILKDSKLDSNFRSTYCGLLIALVIPPITLSFFCDVQPKSKVQSTAVIDVNFPPDNRGWPGRGLPPSRRLSLVGRHANAIAIPGHQLVTRYTEIRLNVSDVLRNQVGRYLSTF